MRLVKSTTFWKRAGISGLVLLVAAELFAKYGLGLGSPPLSAPHPTIEYMYRPNQDVSPFRNRFIVNAYGMRTEQFAKNRDSQDQIRVMVFGDSVVNGGTLTDHQSLATTILSKTWKEIFQTDCIVGNISAGSWGPGNWLAYVKEYGFFDADVIIVVISSHDFNDVPTFEPLDPGTHPQTSPKLAILDGLLRYLPRYLPKALQVETTRKPETRLEATTKGLNDFALFLERAQNSAPFVFVFQYPNRFEAQSGEKVNGYRQIYETCVTLRVPVFSMHSAFHAAIQKGMDPYRPNDVIHPNKMGQELIATEIEKNIPKNTLQPTQ